MRFNSWGNYPRTESRVHHYVDRSDLKSIVSRYSNLISFGNGRSYGDSALAKDIIPIRPHQLFLNFGEVDGLLHVQAGVLLSEILDKFVPRGWFLKISPGTRLITVGGAIASDVHGKNHHKEGCFSECVSSFRLMLPDGNIVECSKQKNSDLFKATCGGMGLTGVILDAQISLMKIASTRVRQTTYRTRNLRDTFDAFEENKNSNYSAAWIDCLANGSALGRSLLTIGDFEEEGPLTYRSNTKLSIPFNLPSILLNTWSVTCFNYIYFKRSSKTASTFTTNIDSFFYPLDSIGNWNRIYGASGFIQYQFVLPKDASYDGLEEVLDVVSKSGQGSFLAVLKLCGRANDNLLSFPMEGYSLALDFKIRKELFPLLDRLDQIILKYKGRLYLAKDSRVSKTVFEQGYPRIEEFRMLRQNYNMNKTFNSLQSKRVGL